MSTNWGAIQRLTRCLLGAQLQVNLASRPEPCATNCRHNPPSGEYVSDGGEARQQTRSLKPGTTLNVIGGQVEFPQNQPLFKEAWLLASETTLRKCIAIISRRYQLTAFGIRQVVWVSNEAQGG